MTAHKAATVAAVGEVVFRWMVDHGYMDTSEGARYIERVHQWDAQDLLDRLEHDGIELRDTTRAAS